MKTWWHSHKVLLLSMSALISFSLGVWGYALLFQAGELGTSYLTVPFLAIRLFLFEGAEVYGLWQLEIARWVAPFVTSCTAIIGTGALFKNQIHDYRLRSLSDHVIICGLGQKGMHLARCYQETHSVVVIEKNEANENIESCRALGMWVIIGDATDSEILCRARIKKAKQTIATCTLDRSNMQIALHAWEINKNSTEDDRKHCCSLHVSNEHLNFLLKQHDIFRDCGDCFEISTFNYFDLAIRKLLNENPLDYWPVSLGKSQRVHLIISGFQKLGQHLLLYAAQIGHFANLQNLMVTVIDCDATEKVHQFRTHYPKIDNVIKLETIDAHIWERPALGRIQEVASKDNNITTLAICQEDTEKSLSEAMELQEKLTGPKIQTCIYLPEGGNLDQLFGSDQRAVLFGQLGSCCTPDIISGELDGLARSIHEDYVNARLSDPYYPEEPESRPALLPWNRLRSDFRDSNRQQADHIPVKLRAVGMALNEYLTGKSEFFDFSDEQLELLSRMEHNRWNADRWLSGWSYGPNRDNDKKLHPNLVPWDELDEKTRDLDRETIRNIPKLVKGMGLKITHICPVK